MELVDPPYSRQTCRNSNRASDPSPENEHRQKAAGLLEVVCVEFATIGGAKAQINMVHVLHRRLTITGSTLRARSVLEKGAIARALRANVWPLVESGAVAPVVHATFPLRAAAEAHRVMEADTHIGKLVLVV